jgi:hypothetical protein
MSNRTATRRLFTRLAPFLTFAVVRSKASRWALLSLLVVSASGCEGNSLTPTPLPPPSATVRLDGRVLDEHNQPVAGARITLTYIHPSRPMADIRATAPSITADDTGAFSLMLDLPADWQQVTLRVDREGYESDARIFVGAAEASRALLINMYRSLTISAGQSIQTMVSLRSHDCGFDGKPCRRVIANSPPGKLLDLEVSPEDGQEYVGLAVRDQVVLGYDFPRRVTVSGGDEVWIVVGQLGRVTLRAARR